MEARALTAMVLAILTLCFFLFPRQAHAYLDPGTGSYILQLALATLVGALFAVTLFWRRIKHFFKNLFSKHKADQDNGQ